MNVMRIRLTESELKDLIKFVIKESENEAMLAEINNDLQEVGLPRISIDDLNSEEIPSSIINAGLKFDPKKGQGENLKSSTFQQIQTAMCNVTENELKKTKNQLKSILKQKLGVGKTIKNIFNNKQNQGSINEQIELGAAVTILSVSAPLWVWLAIGAIVLFLLLRLIVRKRNGYGCHGNESWDHLLWRINR